MSFSVVIFEYIITVLEFIGAGIIVLGLVFSAIEVIINLVKKISSENIYRTLRIHAGRSIIISLEVLIAADIIRSVTIQFSFKSIGMLAIIVLIRTFLSFTLEVEMYGKWPWQKD